MKRADKSELVSLRRTPAGEIVVSTPGVSGGRSVYVCPNENCLNKAIKRKAFSRGLKCEVPENVCEKIRLMFK